MANVNEFSQPIKLLNGGPLDALRGPYATVADACAAIPNVADQSGRNYREGKIVEVGNALSVIEHSFQGGFGDDRLLPRNPIQKLWSLNWARGQDTAGNISTNNQAIVSPFFFVEDMKFLEISYNDSLFPFLTYYKYDKNLTPIARISPPVWRRIEKGTTWIEVESDAVYIRATIVISSSPDTAIPVSFTDNPKISIRKSQKKTIPLNFSALLVHDYDFSVGKFIADTTLAVNTSANTATSLSPITFSGSTISILTINPTSFFWAKILYLDDTSSYISSSAWTVLESNKYAFFAPPANAKKIIVNIINSSSDTSVSSQIAFPTAGFKLNVLEQQPSTPPQKIANTIKVAKSGGDYNTISAAVQAAGAWDTIIVYPGVYIESIHASTKNVNLVGINRETCIVRMDTADRDNPPGEFSGGYVANLTFLQTASTPLAGKDIYTATRGSCGYGIHVDWPASKNNNLLIENCNIISNSDPGIGIGLQPNFTLTLRNCTIKQLIDFENHSATEDIGAIYVHESGGAGAAFDGHDQFLIIDKCTVYNSGKYTVGLSGDHGAAADRSAQIESVNTQYWAKTGGASNSTIYSRTPAVSPAISGNNIFISDKSYGNNLLSINK